MKAALLFGKNDLRIEELAQPQVSPGDLLLRTVCASVCGTDIRMFKHGHSVSPLVIGHEMSGTIECVGAGKVIINDLNSDRLDLARRIDPSFITIGGDPRGELMKLTGGAGADVIITACPVPEVQALAIELAAVNGRVVFFGGLPKDRAVVPLDTNLIHYRQLMVTGTT